MSLRKAAEGSLVISESRFSGTHTGTLQTPGGDIPPTGERIDVLYYGIFDLEGDRIKAQRVYYDRMELLTQLGLAPGPAGA